MCFYHNDADGKCAAYWVYKEYDDVDFIEINYNKKFPLDSIEQGESVWIVDYSIEVEEMKKLLEVTEYVTWIDHHITAIEKYGDFGKDIPGMRISGIAGCMLTYIYIHKKGITAGIREAPLFTTLIADWDVWDLNYGDDTKYFITAFDAYNPQIGDRFWDRLEENTFVWDMVKEGEIMTKFRDGYAASLIKSFGFELEFEGYNCFAMNAGKFSSEFFKSLNKDYDILIPFIYDGSIFTVSLYSSTVDVSKIALKYGGGGHKGAAGFQIKTFPI